MKFTIDTSCIIELEENRPHAVALRELIALSRSGAISLAIPGISASERQHNQSYSNSFNMFLAKLSGVGLSDVEILKPLAYMDICFFDQCILAGEETLALEREIHQVLFPRIEFRWKDYEAHSRIDHDTAYRRWRNAKCDTLSIWSHIYYKCKIFVTHDKNFHNPEKKTKLIDLGAGHIEYAAGALALANRTSRAI